MSGLLAKFIPLETKSLRKKDLFVFQNDGFFKVVKPRECVSNDVVFAREKKFKASIVQHN